MEESIHKQVDEDVVQIHTEYYSVIKKRMKFCHSQQHRWTWRALCQVTQVRERQILYDITYVWNSKNKAN